MCNLCSPITALTQQVVVVQQAARYGVLDGHEAEAGVVVAHLAEYLLKGVAAHQLYVLALKVLMGGYVVKGASNALYCYLLHVAVGAPAASEP